MITPDISMLRAMLAMTGIANTSLVTDDVFLNMWKSAYTQAQRELRVFFEPTEVLPNNALQSEIDAFISAGTPYYLDANADYSTEIFGSESWGFIATRQRPVIVLHSVKILYPASGGIDYLIPTDWYNLDKKYGQIQFVPNTTSFSLPFAGFNLQMMLMANGGIPMALQLRYQAGLVDVENSWPDVINLVNRMALLNILKMAFLPTSQSLSVDGFSRSVSIDTKAWQAQIDELRDSLMNSIHGIRMGCI